MKNFIYYFTIGWMHDEWPMTKGGWWLTLILGITIGYAIRKNYGKKIDKFMKKFMPKD